MTRVPKYDSPFPYDITKTIRSNTKNLDAVSRFAKGSAEYSYDVTWDGNGGGGAIGSGELAGYYRRVGSSVYFRVEMTWGSSTVAPASYFIASLPFPPDDSIAQFIGSALAFDLTGPSGYPGTCLITTENGAFPEGRVYSWTAGNTGRTGATIPFTWAQGDIWRVSGWYTAFDEDTEIPTEG